MARSSGYRPKKKDIEEVSKLREELSKLKYHQWQKATHIMQKITVLTGDWAGPSGGLIEPRACRYCQYYGHTRQYCKQRERDEKLEIENEIAKDKKWREDQQKKAESAPKIKNGQGDYFDSIGWAWVRDEYVGPLPACEEGEGDGLYMIKNGVTVKKKQE